MDLETVEMTAETIGRDLLHLFVSHARMLPDVWAKMSQTQQDETLDAVREGVKSAVEKAVHIIAADNRLVVAGTLDSIAIKNGVRCNVQVSKASENILGLYSAQGHEVLLVVANPTYFTQGIHEVAGESDQRAMDLGHEYNEGESGLDAPEAEAPTEQEDPELETAIQAVQSSGKTSISYIQRTIGVGYNRAARLLEAMEAKGFITAADGFGVRKVQSMSA